MSITLVCEDVVRWAEQYQGPPFHCLVADPPYHLCDVGRPFQGKGQSIDERTGRIRSNQRRQSPGFMGKDWDGITADGSAIAFNPTTWSALARHLLPGAFGLCFASSRGWHRLACAIEDAGLIIHPSIFMLGWVQGAGWPKATKINTQVDAAAGAEQAVIGPGICLGDTRDYNTYGESLWAGRTTGVLTAPATPLAAAWTGHRYGRQALKPSLEPLIVWQVPYQGRPVDCITRTGAGALNIDGARVPGPEPHHNYGRTSGENSLAGTSDVPFNTPEAGRWPANVVLIHTPECEPVETRKVRGTHPPGPSLSGVGYHGSKTEQCLRQNYANPDGTETVQAWRCAPGCPVASLDAQAGSHRAGGTKDCQGQPHGYMEGRESTRQQTYTSYGDTGPVSRFFPTMYWSLDIAERLATADPIQYCAKASSGERTAGLSTRNLHPTVKPLALCRWLATLLLPPAAYAPRRLLVPFCGSGSEIIGAAQTGWEDILGIESDPTYLTIARQRVAYWTGWSPLITEPEGAAMTQPLPHSQLSLW